MALRSNTDPTFSDTLIMAGLTNSTTDDFMAAAIEYADKVRIAGRNIDDRTKGRLIWYYTICLHDRNLLATIGRILPPPEQILSLNWIRQEDISPYDKRIATYFMAHFAQTSGKRDEALRLFSDLARTAPDPREDIARLSQAAASRLQKR